MQETIVRMYIIDDAIVLIVDTRFCQLKYSWK